MQKVLLIKLLKEIESKDFLREKTKRLLGGKNDFTPLLSFSDAQIQQILNLHEEKYQIAQLYLYLKDKILPKEIKDFLSQMIDLKNPHILDLINMEHIFNHQKALSCLYIAANSKETYQIQPINYILSNEHFLQLDDALEILTLISHAKSLIHAISMRDVVYEFTFLQKDNILSFVKIIGNTNEEYQAQYASDVACYKAILEKENAIEYVKIVARANSRQKAEHIRVVSCNEEILNREDSLEFVREIEKVENTNLKAENNAVMVACNRDILKKENALDYVRIIVKAINEGKIVQAESASFVACDTNVNNRSDALEIVNLVIRSKVPVITKDIATNIQVLEREDALMLIELVAKAEEELEARKRAQFIKEELIIDQSNHTTAKIEEVTIQDIMSQDRLADIIHSLIELEDEEITVDTKRRTNKFEGFMTQNTENNPLNNIQKKKRRI